MRKFKLFLFVSVISSVWLYGQSPGGVSTDLSVWYKADAGITTNGSKQVTQWISSSSTSVTLTPSGTAYIPYNDQTTYTNMWNFNPTLSYDGTNNYLRNTTTAYLNPAGSVHYIAVARLSRMTNAYRNLFAIAGNDDGFFLTVNSNTVYPMPTIGNNFNYSAAGPSSTNTFGIYSAILPKTTSQGSQRGFNSGTRKIYSSPYPITGGAYVLPATGIGAYLGADGTTGDNFQGDIAEVILYHSISGGDLTDADLQKIHSYLAIKYGITLDPSQNYVSSTASTVWNATANATYYNNVFGIARDDQGTLYQKQSKSVNPSQKLIIGAGNSLSNTNSANTNTLTDGQFLVVGDNGLKQSLSIPLSYPTAPGGETNNRFASVWKVQNAESTGTVTVAWPKGIANLQLVRSTNDTFDMADQFIPMTSEVTVNGVVYNTATVTFNDGEYFTFAGYAQAPGGVVTGLSHWYRADKAVSNSGEGTDVTSWTDQTSGVTSSQISTALLPKYKVGATNYFNFNPGINFTSDQQKIGNISVQTLNSLDFDIFTLTKEKMTPVGSYGFFNIGRNNTTFDGSNWDSPGLYTNGSVAFRPADGSPLYWANPGGVQFAADIPSIMYYNFDYNATTLNMSINNGLNGNANVGSTTIATENALLTGGHIFGANGYTNPPGGDNPGFIGNIGETIIYGAGSITTAERRRVDSYLAIKYGITLDRVATEHYLSSKSNIIWNGTTNSSYNNNIAGIANDLPSALDQRQSISVNPGQKLIIGTTGLANTNLANAVSLTNDQSLIWGDNGLNQKLSVILNGVAGVNYRFGAIWKDQNTNSVATVRVAWPTGIQNLKLIQSPDEVFDASDTFTDMSANTITINGVTYNYADVTLSNGQFFTFAGSAHAPGGVVNNLAYWYRADKNAVNTGAGTDVTSWTDFYSGTVSSKMYENTFPKYVKGAANYFNYNPGINFTAVKQSLGNDQIASTVTSTDYDIFTFTKEGWAPLNNANNRIFSALANINFQSGDIAYWDGIGVNKRFAGNTADEVESVTVNITDRYLAVPGGINFAATIPSIMYNRFGNTTVSRGLNGGANGANGVFSPRGILTGGHVFGSTIFNSNGSDNDNAAGHIGETIIYGSGNLTETERRRVDSYLAIKYGLTLGRTATNHYMSSTEAVIWNGAQNTSYNSNIFGLGRDDISALHQKVSVSVNSGTILTMATNNDFVTDNLDASRTVISDDQEFFLAGDNNDTDVPMVNVTLGSNTGKIIQRKWLSQRTGTLENTYFQADLSAYESQFNIPGTTIYMVIGDDDTFTTNRLLIPGAKVGGKWIFNHNFDSENTKRYFTFGVLTTEVCYKPGAIITAGNPALISKVGISSLTRAGIQNSDNWPAVRNGAWLVLEARTKGFVVNRMPFNTSGNPEGIPASDFVEGMLVYDTTNKCLKMYTSQNGGSFAWFCISTQTCPD